MLLHAAAYFIIRWITSRTKAQAALQNQVAKEQFAVAQAARKSYENTLRYGKHSFAGCATDLI